MPRGHWWEHLDDDFARRPEKFDLGRADRVQIGAAAAFDHFTLVPAMSTGFFAPWSNWSASITMSSEGATRGGAVRIGGNFTRLMSASSERMSVGISRNAGPGIPETA